jgi:hypothetical protein
LFTALFRVWIKLVDFYDIFRVISGVVPHVLDNDIELESFSRRADDPCGRHRG